MSTFIGWQVCDSDGRNIQGDDNDPLHLMSFEIVHPEDAHKVAYALGSRYRLMPIFSGDIEEPKVVRFV